MVIEIAHEGLDFVVNFGSCFQWNKVIREVGMVRSWTGKKGLVVIEISGSGAKRSGRRWTGGCEGRRGGIGTEGSRHGLRAGKGVVSVCWRTLQLLVCGYETVGGIGGVVGQIGY